jgi:hypothetical protein
MIRCRTHRPIRRPARRGMASVLAMMFLAIFGSLAAAMMVASQTNLQSADTYQHSSRALAAAETGVEFARYRLATIAATVTTDKGSIDSDLADVLWGQVAASLFLQATTESQFDGSATLDYDADGNAQKLTLPPISMQSGGSLSSFQITLEQHPIDGEDYDGAYYQRSPFNVGSGLNEYTTDGNAVTASNPVAPWYVRMAVVGSDQGIDRTINLDLRIDKKVRYAILSRNRIMIGRNVIVKGPIGSHYTEVDERHGHPVQMRDNFHGLSDTLDTYLNELVSYLAGNDVDGDNRVLLADVRESGNLTNAASLDQNNDGYVDQYDMFVLAFDGDSSGSISADEFSSGGAMVDEQLWRLINEAKYPAGTEFDWAAERVKLPGGAWTDASGDFAVIDNADDYAKVHGEIMIKADKSSWESGAAEGPYQNYLRGSISPDEYQDPMTFQADATNLASLDPTDFDVSGYKTMATGSFADQTASPTANDSSSPTAYTPPGPGTLESVPYNSPYPYDHYARPVYENMVFTDVNIPRGTNALFVNCKFVGVTFVDTETQNTDPNFNYAGMQNADGSAKYVDVVAEVGGVEVSDTKTLSNNVRFHDCTFEGIVVTEAPETFSHVRNKVQFTGDTRFDIEAPSLNAEQKALFAKSTIMAPQHSIDIGTFTDPTDSGEVTKLEGTIVAGVLDVRGQAEINGSIITTFEPVAGEGVLTEGGSPANFNTTIGYFESAAGDSEAELPSTGYGKIIIRYDPYRPIPDGITGPIEMNADMDTYFEGGM